MKSERERNGVSINVHVTLGVYNRGDPEFSLFPLESFDISNLQKLTSGQIM